MPIVNGVGWSPATPRKQYALNKAFGHILGTSAVVAQKRNRPCFICDMTAGPGRDTMSQDGSPLIFARHIRGMIDRGYQITLICTERESNLLEQLRAVMGERYPNLPVEYFSDQAKALARVPTQAVGLTYWDPNGYKELDHDLLTRFSQAHYHMDILITRECLAGKRMQGANCTGTLTIQDYLALTRKKCNYIMQYADWQWWSFGFASNWEQRPPGRLGGFYEVNSEEGRKRFSKFILGVSEPDTGPNGNGFGQEGLPW